MLDFDLSVMPADADLNSAFGKLFEDQRSALVVEGAKGVYRLVTYPHLTEAAAHGAKLLGQVHGQRLDSLEKSSRSNYTTTLAEADLTFGLVNVDNGMASLFSVSESIAFPLTAASTVARCDRPGLPPGRTPGSWYHYYPPNNAQPLKPYPCTVKGCTGQVW
jgi:hypothetical protein